MGLPTVQDRSHIIGITVQDASDNMYKINIDGRDRFPSMKKSIGETSRGIPTSRGILRTSKGDTTTTTTTF